MTGLFSHTKKSFPNDRQPEVLKKPRRISARTQALVMVKSRRSLNSIFTPILYKFYVQVKGRRKSFKRHKEMLSLMHNVFI